AHAPTLLLASAVADRRVQDEPRLLLTLLLREEDREVPAENFRRLIPLDMLRSFVPGDHVSVGVEHEDRIILYPFYQHSESFFEAPGYCFGALPLIDLIPKDLVGFRKVSRPLVHPCLQEAVTDV